MSDSHPARGAIAAAVLLYLLHALCFSGKLWQWNEQAWAGNERLRFALISSLFLEVTYWLAQLLNWLIMRDASLYQRWAIAERGDRVPPAPELLRKCLTDLSVSHCVRPVLLYAAYSIYLARGAPSSAALIPTATELVAHLAFAIAVDDTMFYWAHRALHHPRVYKHIHKQHHEFKQPVGLATEYAHPLEEACNTLATALGPLLLGSHVAVSVGYMGLKLWQSIDAHSGMLLPAPLSPWNLLPGMDCAAAHDFHHSHNVGNFGGFFTFWDRVCGTDAAYRRFLEKKKQR